MLRKTFFAIVTASLLLGLSSCGEPETAKLPARFDAEAALALVEALSADDLKGRGIGTDGNAKAREIISQRMAKIGLRPAPRGYEIPFTYRQEGKSEDTLGVNLVGQIDGNSGSNLAMVVSAHYDHLGEVDGKIYNGADDNASGVAGMLAIAEYFSRHPPIHDIIIVAFDAEEAGHGGSASFVADPPLPIRQIVFNLNLDMISRGDNGLLWASGLAHTPELKPMVESVAIKAPVTINMGYDSAAAPDDWTLLSDHAAFFRAGVPYLYLGVEDHPDYHQPSDTFEKIDQAWFLGAIEAAVMMAAAADARLADIAELGK
ncbi:MAG: M28 family peptidase [Woeseiaceae bacterium]